MDEASRLHFGKFNASKFTQFHKDGLDEVSSTLQSKKQLCHKMWPKMTNCFSSSNLTAVIYLVIPIWLLGRGFRCVNITGHLSDEYENTFSPLYPHFWRKLSIGQGVFELRRITEHWHLWDQIYEISFDHWVRVPFRPEFLRPFFRYCLSSKPSLSLDVSWPWSWP